MFYKNINLWKTVDWITILLYLIMIVAGWLTICSASYDFDSVGFFDPSGRPGTQLIWFGISFAFIFLILMLESDYYELFAYILYFFVILLLIFTIFFAPDIKGSHSWLKLGPISLQPAEFAKFATALALAKFMNGYGFKLTTVRNFSRALGLILLPMICIILQRETGSALVYLAFFLVLYREGMSGYFLLAGLCAVIYFVTSMKYEAEVWGITPLGEFIVTLMILVISVILIYITQKDNRQIKIISGVILGVLVAGYIVSLFVPVNFVPITIGLILLLASYLIALSLKRWVAPYALIALFAIGSLGFLYSVDYVFNDVLGGHQQTRIRVSLGLEDDPTGAGYNVNQSKIAVGSGGLYGKGFLNGTQTKLKYVPEQDTDFIFCTIGEEFGFLGSVFVLLLFAVFIIRIVMLAERQHNAFGRVYGYSVAAIFFFHLAINVGMVIGLTPVIGIPLPFFSYGGSSFLGFTILLFIFLRIDASRKVR